MTTIKELYEWAVKCGVDDLPIGIVYQDSGGSYFGDTWIDGQQAIAASVETTDGINEYVLLG